MSVCGTITSNWLEKCGTRKDWLAECSRFVVGSTVYYYFDGEILIGDDRPLSVHIARSRSVGSVAKGLTTPQILASLGSDNPHYGDGTYVTFHGALKTSHKEVKRNHGMQVSARTYRAVLKIVDARRFNRVLQTAGVGLAEPDGPVEPGTVVLLQAPHEIRILHLERWTGGEWKIWMPPSG